MANNKVEVSSTILSRCAQCPNREPEPEGEKYSNCPLNLALKRMGDNPTGRRVVLAVMRAGLNYRSSLTEQSAENAEPVHVAYLACPNTEENPGQIMIQCQVKQK